MSVSGGGWVTATSEVSESPLAIEALCEAT